MYPTRMLRMQPTRAFAFPTPRLRQLKRVPPELLPIGFVLAYVSTLFDTICRLIPGTHARHMPEFHPPISLHWQSSFVALGAAVYSGSKKLMTDKTLRLYRNSPESHDH
ncbi:unnamed protein product [Penicillium crustosum]